MIKIQTFDDKGPITQIVSLALFEDLAESIYMMEYGNGVRPYVLEWYYDVFLPTFEAKTEPNCKFKTAGRNGGEQECVRENRIAITTTELIEASKRIKGKHYTSHNMLQTLVYPLMNQGFIDSIESELDRRTKILFPVIPLNSDMSRRNGKNILFSIEGKQTHFPDAFKVSLADPTTFPNITYLISRIQWLQKCYSDDGILTLLCDHESKQISIEDLVKRYYVNPENYFEVTSEDDSMKNILKEVKSTPSSNNDSGSMQNSEDS